MEGTIRERGANDLLVAFCLFVFLAAAYTLTGTTNLQLTSDEGVNLALVESIAKFGRFDIEQMAVLTRAIPAEHGLDGLHYSKYGLSQAFLSLPLYWLAMASPSVGQIHVVLLFCALVTALAGAFVYLLARGLGYGVYLALALALLFGLASPAWVYTKRYMSEPLSALSLVAGAYFALRAARGRWGWALLAGAALAAGVLNKVANAAFAPAFVVYLLLAGGPVGGWAQRLAWRRGWARVLAFASPVAAALAVFAYYNHARFGNPLQTGYGPNEGFNVPIYEGLAGLLLSPGKSAFIYFPILVLLPVWARAFLRRRPAEGWLFLALVAGHFLLYATWWIWWGGWNWGVRFLIPAWAFAVLLLGDGLGAWRDLRLPARAAVALLVTLSVGVQALGVAVDHSVFIASLMPLSIDPERLTLVDLAYQPVLNQFRFLKPPYLDFGWLLQGGQGGVDTIALAWLVAAALAGLGALILAVRAPRPVAALASLGAIAVLWLASTTHLERAYAREDPSARQIVAQLREKASPNAALLYMAPRFTSLWENAAKVAIPTWGTYEEKDPKPATLARLERLAATVDEVWVVSEYPPAAPESGIERWLASHGFRQSERWYGPFRLACYRMGGESDAGWASLGTRLGPNVLLAGFQVEDPARPRRAGETLNLGLRWQALAAVGGDYTVFVHLLDGAEKVWGQQDVAPGAGFSPTGGWRPGQVLDDRYALPVDPAAPPGEYRIEVGMYLPQTGARLPVLDEKGGEVGNRVILPVTIIVVAP